MVEAHNRLPAFLMNLGRLAADDQFDAFVNEIMETSGRFDTAPEDGVELWKLSLHGISAHGATEQEAITRWMQAARLVCPLDDAEDDGFITVHPPIKKLGVA
jgi:hypothetical protein